MALTMFCARKTVSSDFVAAFQSAFKRMYPTIKDSNDYVDHQRQTQATAGGILPTLRQKAPRGTAQSGG
jgi:hypothetical protein